MSNPAEQRPIPDDVTADVVALALGALEPADTERVRAAIDADPALRSELDAVATHLRLHDSHPSLAPTPAN